ncbi:MAG TPA: hypothetical protein VIG64_11275 [Actinomycetota bacterium]|jgi:vacuolar-type H+-ATPase subunit H
MDLTTAGESSRRFATETGRDALEEVAEQLEQAEAAGDEERLAVLDRAHARLAGELDSPAAEPLAR